MDLLKSKIFPYLSRVRKLMADSLFFVIKPFKKKKTDSDFTDLDKKLVYSLSHSKIPNFNQIKYIGKVLSKKEIWVIRFLFVFVFINIVFLSGIFLKNHLLIGPVFGGEYKEGLVGSPKNINPLYSSLSDVDNDISRLVFSSLFRYDKNGELISDLVQDFEISEDGKSYTLVIRDDVRWHHGGKLTTDDIVFTFNAIRNSEYGSSLRLAFSGVSIEKKEDNKIAFILSEKCAPFLELLTFGILPEDLWSQITPRSANLAEINLKPIGSGPYKFKSLIKDKSGNIKSYNLEANTDYYESGPYIANLSFSFFVNFTEAINALNENIVNGISYLPNKNKNDLIARDSLDFHKLNLPQIKAIFFNQNKNQNLKDVKIRQALALSIPRHYLIEDVLQGDAEIISGPILPSSFAYNFETEKYDFDLEKANNLFTEAGWEKTTVSQEEIDEILVKERTATSTEEKLTQEEEDKKNMGAGEWRFKKPSDKKPGQYLTISLSAVEDEENLKVIENIKKYWEEAGVKIILKMIPANQVRSIVIEARDFESLFFGQLVGHDPDSYVFWHSSQKGSGGLNLSDYSNDDVDRALEEARLTLDNEERKEKYKKFQEILAQDVPAIFLYSPFYVYVQGKKVKGFEVENISSPADRFADIKEWYVKTGRKLAW